MGNGFTAGAELCGKSAEFSEHQQSAGSGRTGLQRQPAGLADADQSASAGYALRRQQSAAGTEPVGAGTDDCLRSAKLCGSEKAVLQQKRSVFGTDAVERIPVRPCTDVEQCRMQRHKGLYNRSAAKYHLYLSHRKSQCDCIFHCAAARHSHEHHRCDAGK